MATSWIGPEEHAYNTYAGGHSRSGRRGIVWWPDGKLRAVRLGVPDTFFSIPAHGYYHGRYMAGFVCVVDDDERPAHAPVQYEFHPYAPYSAMFDSAAPAAPVQSAELA